MTRAPDSDPSPIRAPAAALEATPAAPAAPDAPRGADAGAIAAEILRQTAARGAERSICPSEVARALAGGLEGPWRPLMGPVRAVAARLAREGRVEILRKGRPLPPDQAPHGVIRLRIAAGGDTPGGAGGDAGPAADAAPTRGSGA